MSEVVDALRRGRAVAWASLQPAFDHALALAMEAEHLASKTSQEYATYVTPAYPPLVRFLADAGEGVPG